MKARSFCPGHITGFFEICRAENILATGSRGAGVCITLGAESEVRVEEADRHAVEVTVNGRAGKAEVTRRALEHLLPEKRLSVRVDTLLGLPESQGFGMSAAGALSACVAIAHVLGIDRQKAFEATHAAEIECGAGLGDVSAIHRGGVTIRELPGLPPTGRVHRIDEEMDIVLAVVGPPMRTADMLSDAGFSSRINTAGSSRVEELLSNPTSSELMRLAGSFALETHLAQGRVLEAMEAASAVGTASMVMLGNSVFAVGQPGELASVLREFGEVARCSVDTGGVRILEG